eukprot:jgi/Mesvir1/18537/Mv11542-RA.1
MSAGPDILSILVKTTSAPIGTFVAEPVTLLHKLDPRVKQAWLLALVFLPARAPLSVRLGAAAFTLLVTVATQPRRSWPQQLLPLAFLCWLVFMGSALGSDGVPPVYQTRGAPMAWEGEAAAALTTPWHKYAYVVFRLGPLQVTRRGLNLAATVTSLTFTVLQAANLTLNTTRAESLAASLRWFLQPLRLLGVGVNQMVLLLLLALRFMALVFEEVRNLALGLVARGVDWKALGSSGTMNVLSALSTQLFRNLFAHADQISQAMVVRGFQGVDHHQLYLMEGFAFHWRDWVALGMLAVVTALAVKFVIFV